MESKEVLSFETAFPLLSRIGNGMGGEQNQLEVEISSENVLSNLLDSDKYHVLSKPEDLAFPRRFELMAAKLEIAMKRGVVVCLQEVSLEWCDKLIPLFQRRHYNVRAQSFGKFPDYWGGILIAVPPRFQVESYRTVCVGQEIAALAALHATPPPPLSSSTTSSSSSSSPLPPPSSLPSPLPPKSDTPEKKKTPLTNNLYTTPTRLKKVWNTGIDLGKQSIGVLTSVVSLKGAIQWDKGANS